MTRPFEAPAGRLGNMAGVVARQSSEGVGQALASVAPKPAPEARIAGSCQKTGPCPCADPCHYFTNAQAVVDRGEWPDPDAELLALCADFHRGQAITGAWEAGTIGGEAGDTANDAQWAVMERLFALPARTTQGAQAKAAVVAAAAPGFFARGHDDMVCKMAASLAADVLGRAV